MNSQQKITDRVDSISRAVHGKLIVSCQALPGEPLFGSVYMAALSVAAEQGGAAAIRANSPTDITAIRAVVSLPIIGLNKRDIPGYEVYITPTIDDAIALAEAGSDIIAIDATDRPRPSGPLYEYVRDIKNATHCGVLADISTYEEGIAAAAAGADFVSTTLSGYTSYSPDKLEPDIDLVRRLSQHCTVPVIAEGRISTPEQAFAMLEAGAWAVIVGGAITRPRDITRRFAEALGSSCVGSEHK